MKKRIIAMIAVLAMFVTVFAGCSENNDRRERESNRKEDRDEREKDNEGEALKAVLEQLIYGTEEEEKPGKRPVKKPEEKVIHVMSFTDEVPNMVQTYLDMHPELGYTMKCTIVSTIYDEYRPALDEMLKYGGEDAPDIYSLEAAFVAKYTKGDMSSYAASYDELGIQTDKMIQESKTATYAVEVGTRPTDGEVVALPYQSGAGCFIYRRSIAKNVWGTDDPAVIQKKIGGASGQWDNFWVAAEELKSNGYAIVSGDGDMWHALENSADNGWIKDGELYLDPKREAFMDVSKMLKDNNYHNETQDWQDVWFADIRGEGRKEVFGFFGPAWFVNYTMADNCGNDRSTEGFGGTYGDWAVCNSPVGFYWGGNWVAANKDVVKEEKKDVIADILQWITLDYDENSLQYMLANGLYESYSDMKDAVVSGRVMEKSDGSLDFLGGQNMFEYFVPANDYATGNNITPYDEAINSAWREAARDYAKGKVDRYEAIAQFADEVRSKIDIQVPESFYYGRKTDFNYDFGYIGGGITTPVPTPTPGITPTPTSVPDRDLQGLQMIIGDWYSMEGEAIPVNMYEDQTAKYRQQLFEKYNFSVDKRTVAGWGEMEDTYVNSVMAANPVAHVFELDYRFISTPMSYGLFYDLATLEELDFSEEKWNESVKNLMTKGNYIYGMSPEANVPGGGLVWNKRLFEEAGVDPHLTYDLQATGEWTWDMFRDVCAALTRDENGDGITDVYALTGDGAEIVRCLVASTGEDFFTKDEEGNLYNNMASDSVLAAMEFAVELYEAGYVMPQPEGSNWDYYVTAFQEGKAAMTFAEEYRCEPNREYGDFMEDEVGFALPPKPDYGASYHSYVNNNIYVIPSCYDAEMASRIAFAFNLYTTPTPGYDDPDDWIERYYAHFGEERAVDETIAFFANTAQVFYPLDTLVSDDYQLENDLLWKYPFTTETPRERVEAIRESWNALLEEANQK